MLIAKEQHAFFDGQICLFIEGIDNPYNAWSKAEFSQGFAYRPQSVSFRTTFEAGDCEVSVHENEDSFDRDAVVIISVPITIDKTQRICIASVIDGAGDEIKVCIPPGKYSLRYEAFSKKGDTEFAELQNVKFVFTKKADAEFSISKAEQLIQIPDELYTDGQAAE